MCTPMHLQILGTAFEGQLKKALDELQEERGLNGWPAAGARFELECSTIRFEPCHLTYEFQAIAAILSPESDEHARHLMRTVSELFVLEALSVDEENLQVVSPYLAANAAVLSYRIGKVLSERIGR